MGASPAPGEAREAARGSTDTSRERRPLLGPLVPAHIRIGGLLGSTGPVQRLSRGPQSSDAATGTASQGRGRHAGPSLRRSSAPSYPWLASLSLAEPGRAGCGLSRLGHDARIPDQPLCQSQVFLGVRVRSRLSSLRRHLLWFCSSFSSLPAPSWQAGAQSHTAPRSSGWRREGRTSGRQAGEAHTAQPRGAGLGSRSTSAGRRGFPERSQAAAQACDTAREKEVIGRGAEDQRARGQPRQSQGEGQHGTPAHTPLGPTSSPLGSSRDRPGPVLRLLAKIPCHSI